MNRPRLKPWSAPGGHRRIVVVDIDSLHADALCRAAARVFPDVTVEKAPASAADNLLFWKPPIWLLIASIENPTDAILRIIRDKGSDRRKIEHCIVVTSRRDQRMLQLLSAASVNAIFDPSSEGLQGLRFALRSIHSGCRYLSPSISDTMIKWKLSPNSIDRLLSAREQRIFSVIGDGRDDQSAAELLKLSPSTVQSARRNIHRKLGISHKGDLIRLAAQHGYVQFTVDGVIHPGFEHL